MRARARTARAGAAFVVRRCSGDMPRRGRRSSHSYAPPEQFVRRATPDQIERVRQLLHPCTSLLVLTGAGMSTESGVPSFRGPHLAKDDYKPIQYHTFVGSEEARQRYWARSFLGYARMFQARPNAGHLALAAWQRAVPSLSLITQNVDSNHHKAGSRDVLELHGHLRGVQCLKCHWQVSRALMQDLLREMNPAWAPFEQLSQRTLLPEDSAGPGYARARPDGDADIAVRARPDGDADFARAMPHVSTFRTPPCPACASSLLKPTIVFYGENVPAASTARSLALAEACDGLLVLGSTLHTYSAFRLVKAAATRRVPVCIVTVGPTRADALPGLSLKLDDLLSRVVRCARSPRCALGARCAMRDAPFQPRAQCTMCCFADAVRCVWAAQVPEIAAS